MEYVTIESILHKEKDLHKIKKMKRAARKSDIYCTRKNWKELLGKGFNELGGCARNGKVGDTSTVAALSREVSMRKQDVIYMEG